MRHRELVNKVLRQNPSRGEPRQTALKLRAKTGTYTMPFALRTLAGFAYVGERTGGDVLLNLQVFLTEIATSINRDDGITGIECEIWGGCVLADGRTVIARTSYHEHPRYDWIQFAGDNDGDCVYGQVCLFFQVVEWDLTGALIRKKDWVPDDGGFGTYPHVESAPDEVDWVLLDDVVGVVHAIPDFEKEGTRWFIRC